MDSLTSLYMKGDKISRGSWSPILTLMLMRCTICPRYPKMKWTSSRTKAKMISIKTWGSDVWPAVELMMEHHRWIWWRLQSRTGFKDRIALKLKPKWPWKTIDKSATYLLWKTFPGKFHATCARLQATHWHVQIPWTSNLKPQVRPLRMEIWSPKPPKRRMTFL